jgi:hypothetical protein
MIFDDSKERVSDELKDEMSINVLEENEVTSLLNGWGGDAVADGDKEKYVNLEYFKKKSGFNSPLKKRGQKERGEYTLTPEKMMNSMKTGKFLVINIDGRE